MKKLQRRKRVSLFLNLRRLIYMLMLFLIIFFNCNRAGEDPARILNKFFKLINEGSYRKAASLCTEDIDPFFLDFTNIVSLRFIDKVIVREDEISRDRASFYVYLFLKDGKELAYYKRTKKGALVPGTMKLKRIDVGGNVYEWRLECDEFWESYHWKDISRKIRLNIIAVIEEVIQYRESEKQLPRSLDLVLSEALDSIMNPVTGEEEVYVDPENIRPGVVSFYYDKERDEVGIKGFGPTGEQLDYFIVSRSKEMEKAELLEFFDVPPITITTVIPGYPESERKKGTEGIVTLRLLIGRDGMVQEVNIEKQLSPIFDSVATEAVKHSVFSPAKRDGKPVSVWYYFPVRFVLTK